jgi:hypothetical protein
MLRVIDRLSPEYGIKSVDFLLAESAEVEILHSDRQIYAI